MDYKKNIGLVSINPPLQLTFGADRQTSRNQLSFDATKNFGRNDNEDSYPDVAGNWLRLSFTDNKLEEIELLRGVIFIDNIEIKTGNPLDKTIKSLKDKGFSFKKGFYSYTDFENLVDIGDSEANGGDENEVKWFYTSTNFDHLID